ncbi:MAG: SRPBCC domain-containing protein [Saprospiraceae bacterium]|nr:SRPBCC domain-containing protein [Saprospiraceae bacterium]
MNQDQSRPVLSPITIRTSIEASLDKVWQLWTEPMHISQWCQASDDWHAPHAENDPRTGGKFKTVMAAKDGSFSFDFEGVYTHVKSHEIIEYDLSDGRHVAVHFSKLNNEIEIVQTFDPETQNPMEMQQQGWQSILENFRNYVETTDH